MDGEPTSEKPRRIVLAEEIFLLGERWKKGESVSEELELKWWEYKLESFLDLQEHIEEQEKKFNEIFNPGWREI